MHWLEAAAEEGAASIETFVQSNVGDGARADKTHGESYRSWPVPSQRQGDTKPDCIDFAGREDPPK